MKEDVMTPRFYFPVFQMFTIERFVSESITFSCSRGSS
jgi:hypothetical protein